MAMAFITTGIISLLATTIGVLIACKIQAHFLHKTGLEREAWQYAQEAHQNLWGVKQRKLTHELEESLNKQIEELQEEWYRWKFNAAHQYEKLTLEQNLLHFLTSKIFQFYLMNTPN